MTTRQVEQLIDKAHQKGAEQITFTGGEPTIRKDIIHLVNYANKLGFKTIMFTTNARMLSYYDFAKKLVDSGANKFMISLHAHNKELYQKLSRVDGFTQAVQGIKNIVKLNQQICASFVVNRLNYKILPEYAEFLPTIGIRDLLQMTYVMPCGGNLRINKANIPRFSEAVPYIKKTIDIKDNIGIKDMIVMDVPLCFLVGYEKYINEFSIPHMEIYAANPEHSTEDYNLRRKINKSKPNKCKPCRYYEICEGAWPEYFEIYGDEEFKAIKE
jgi:radical SAM protein with 4Fe4S-binding SPASM domain